jgi:NTP pyrophosphatase (non-canonical NTP hydrolase)
MGFGPKDATYKGLTFRTLRAANRARIPTFKNKHGELAHTKPDGSDWSPSQWLQAVVGELGEYANIRKKFERGDMGIEEFRREAAKELADVQTYLDILALRCLDTALTPDPNGIDLGQATLEKFNEISRRVGSKIVINDDGSDWSYSGP